MRLAPIVNILDLLVLLSPTALQLLQVQGIPGSLAWYEQPGYPRVLGSIAHVQIPSNDYHDARHPIPGFTLLRMTEI
jgi:hypothetical protein